MEAAAAQAPRLDEQHLHNILLAAAQLPLHMPEPATAGGPPRRCAGLAHLEALRGKLLRRLAVASRPVKGFTPTCQGICRAIWALAVLQVSVCQGCVRMMGELESIGGACVQDRSAWAVS